MIIPDPDPDPGKTFRIRPDPDPDPQPCIIYQYFKLRLCVLCLLLPLSRRPSPVVYPAGPAAPPSLQYTEIPDIQTDLILKLQLYWISGLFWYPVSGWIFGFICRISCWPDIQISGQKYTQNC